MELLVRCLPWHRSTAHRRRSHLHQLLACEVLTLQVLNGIGPVQHQTRVPPQCQVILGSRSMGQRDQVEASRSRPPQRQTALGQGPQRHRYAVQLHKVLPGQQAVHGIDQVWHLIAAHIHSGLLLQHRLMLLTVTRVQLCSILHLRSQLRQSSTILGSRLPRNYQSLSSRALLSQQYCKAAFQLGGRLQGKICSTRKRNQMCRGDRKSVV